MLTAPSPSARMARVSTRMRASSAALSGNNRTAAGARPESGAAAPDGAVPDVASTPSRCMVRVCPPRADGAIRAGGSDGDALQHILTHWNIVKLFAIDHRMI